MRILMVCLGNICRSPLAEGLLKHKAAKSGLNWTIESAGTNGYHTGEAPHHLSQKVAKCNGIDISTQTARRFTKDDIQKYDLIYTMAEDVMTDVKKIAGEAFDKNKIRFFLSELKDSEDINVPDPWYGEEDGYHEVFTLIDKACDAIIINYHEKVSGISGII